MQTKVVKIDPFQIDENEMKEAADGTGFFKTPD